MIVAVLAWGKWRLGVARHRPFIDLYREWPKAWGGWAEWLR